MWPMSAGLRLRDGREEEEKATSSSSSLASRARRTCLHNILDVRVCATQSEAATPVCGVKRAQVGGQQALQLPGELALCLQDVLQDLRKTHTTHKHTKNLIFMKAAHQQDITGDDRRAALHQSILSHSKHPAGRTHNVSTL